MKRICPVFPEKIFRNFGESAKTGAICLVPVFRDLLLFFGRDAVFLFIDEIHGKRQENADNSDDNGDDPC